MRVGDEGMSRVNTSLCRCDVRFGGANGFGRLDDPGIL
jgi:hypothetical protein